MDHETASATRRGDSRVFPQAPILQSVDETARHLGPAFPAPTLRDLVYHSAPRLAANGELKPANGFAICIVRIGGRVLLDWERLLEWIETHRQSHQNGPVA